MEENQQLTSTKQELDEALAMHTLIDISANRSVRELVQKVSKFSAGYVFLYTESINFPLIMFLCKQETHEIQCNN